MAKASYFESIRTSIRSDEQMALEFLFPAKDKFKQLQMLNELKTREVMSWSVLGVFRRKYKSKFLRDLQEESALNKIAQERKGRLEGTELSSAGSKKAGKEDED